MRARIRSSLFLKIYATVLATLALVAIASAVFVALGQDEDARGWAARRDGFIAAMVPADAAPDELRFALRRLSVAFDAGIAVYDANRELIARAGPPLPHDMLERAGRHHRDGRLFVTQLPDGRYIAARLNRPPGPSPRGPLLYLAMIALVIGIAAYPVVRHLTRRLEGLRRGVESWDGAHLVRVPVDGSDEVAAVAASFNAAAERIEKMVAAHRALLANASHELRSPLARLRMATDLYQDNPRDETRDEIIRNLSELDMLVEEILLASRLDHVEALETREHIDLLALVSEEVARNGLTVDGVPVTVDGDPRLLTRLVRNLIQNALRHGAPPVEISLATDAGGPVLTVRDHGEGIAEADRTRVFEPFFRPSGRSERAGGWGLGLSLVRQIAAHHGATVRIDAPAGGGTAFVVSFPASA